MRLLPFTYSLYLENVHSKSSKKKIKYPKNYEKFKRLLIDCLIYSS